MGRYPPDWRLSLPGDGEAEGAVGHALAVQVLGQTHNKEIRHALEHLERHLGGCRRRQGEGESRGGCGSAWLNVSTERLASKSTITGQPPPVSSHPCQYTDPMCTWDLKRPWIRRWTCKPAARAGRRAVSEPGLLVHPAKMIHTHISSPLPSSVATKEPATRRAVCSRVASSPLIQRAVVWGREHVNDGVFQCVVAC